MQHEPFRLEIALRTPAIMQPDMTLDALLAAAIYQRTGSIEQAHAQTPLACSDGVWHASRLRAPHGEYGRAVFVSRLTRSDAGHGRYKGGVVTSGPNRGQVRIDTAMGTYAPRLNEHPTWMGVLVCEGMGDAEQACALLRSLHGIGRAVRQGHGRIAQIHAVQLDADVSVIAADGAPARPVPLPQWQALGGRAEGIVVEDAAWRPAYWNPENRTYCAVPC